MAAKKTERMMKRVKAIWQFCLKGISAVCAALWKVIKWPLLGTLYLLARVSRQILLYYYYTKQSYQTTWVTLAGYWKHYQGHKIPSSFYFHIALCMLALTSNDWMNKGNPGTEWWTTVISINPSMIGFTLGGYAILLGFGDERFKKKISGERDGRPSPYIKISATFLHFIVVQIFALCCAIVARSLNGHRFDAFPSLRQFVIQRNMLHALTCAVHAFWAFGYLLFLYSLSLSAAAAFGVYKLSRALDRANREPTPKTQKQCALPEMAAGDRMQSE